MCPWPALREHVCLPAATRGWSRAASAPSAHPPLSPLPPRPAPAQDPADRSVIVADDALRGLTGEERFKGFGFSKLVKQHLLG